MLYIYILIITSILLILTYIFSRGSESDRIYQHVKSGKYYVIVEEDALTQIDGVWIKSVIYKSLEGRTDLTFVRLKDEFDSKFKLIE